MTHVHLIGIGGSGLSAIGSVLLERGYHVSGSDMDISPYAQRLKELGAYLYKGHHPENVKKADFVIRSSAIPDDNVEVQSALSSGIPVFKRGEFLGQLTDNFQTIAIAGTHGKTTTTAMIAWILTALNQDPSYIIGSVAINLRRNARAGNGPTFVIEADEYDHMFLGLSPSIAVVTNLEHDHLDCFPTSHDYYQAFLDFVDRIVVDGVLLACGDDPKTTNLLNRAAVHNRRTLSYGLGQNQDFIAMDYSGKNLRKSKTGDYTFDVFHGSSKLVQVDLKVPGVHNVQNGLAAIATAKILGLPVDEASRALGEFRGTERRFQICGEAAGVLVIDDYAHHPSEIQATLSAARERYPDRRIWAIWQPHTYSRTRALMTDFAVAFESADNVLVLEVFPAREPVNAEFSAFQVVEIMDHRNAYFIAEIPKAADFLMTKLEPGDLVLVLSAGDGNKLSSKVLAELKKQEISDV